MIKLTDILIESMAEASLSTDANKSVRAKEYIKKIDDLISNYRSDNKEIKVKGLGSLSYVEIDLGDLLISILPTDKGSTRAKFFPKTDKEKPHIDIYRANIETKPKLDVEYDEQDFYHELIHYFDYSKVKTDPKDLDTSYQKTKAKRGYAGYINNPFEVNAHFFEYFMPEVVKFIEKEKQIPDSFNDFMKDLMKDSKAKEFLGDLDEKNKKKVMKRLGTYYNDILKNPDFKIEKGNEIDDQQLKKATSGFIGKLKGVLKIK